MKKLFKAIRNGDFNEVKEIITKKPELVNCVAKQPPKKDDGQSPLQVALKTGNFEIAKYLIEMGADLNFMEDKSCCNEWRTPVIHDAITAAVNSKNAGNATKSNYTAISGQNGDTNLKASNIVLWSESHDTYEGSAGSAGISNTSNLTDDVITKSWALVAARKDSTALFFARPAAKMGQASSNTTYKSAAVSEVNKFKNAFVGQ